MIYNANYAIYDDANVIGKTDKQIIKKMAKRIRIERGFKLYVKTFDKVPNGMSEEKFFNEKFTEFADEDVILVSAIKDSKSYDIRMSEKIRKHLGIENDYFRTDIISELMKNGEFSMAMRMTVKKISGFGDGISAPYIARLLIRLFFLAILVYCAYFR